MPKEQSKRGGGSRRRPVSCLFCRSRKLRCSREAPCTNCKSRGIECELETLARSPNNTDGPSKADLLERIRVLEEIVARRSQDTPSNSYVRSPSQNDDHSIETNQKSSMSPDIGHFESDVAWLSSIYAGSKRSPDDLPSDSVDIRICPTKHIIETSRSMHSDESLLAKGWPRKLFWIPPYSEAKPLVEKFLQHIEPIHHVFYTPALPAMLDRIYSRLSQRGCIKSGEMILLLSIFASSTRSWTERDCCKRGLFSTAVEAHCYSGHWVKVAEDMLDFARRKTHISIEGVQAAIVLLFVPECLEGFWRRSRSIYSTALLLARELGLHCIDLPCNAHQANSIQAEIGRRVWWHLVATDWAMAPRFEDIPRGFYQCHLRHMMTHKPLNLDDEDLVDGMSRTGRPMSQPTVASYGLFRLRMCEIARNLVDRTPIGAINGEGPSHDVVMDIDTEMQVFLNELPPFFSMSVPEMVRTYHLEPSKAAVIAHQGRILRSLFHGQRCKMHLPYLGRGYTDRNYALSRHACVQSARLIINNESDPEKAGLCAISNYQPLGLIMGVFMACVVLLMELCHNKSSPHLERQRSEISSAFRLLEDARQESKMAEKFITSMMQVLHKHQITPPKIAPSSRAPTADVSHARAPAIAPSSVTEVYGAPTVLTPNSLSCPMQTNGDDGDQHPSSSLANDVDLPYFPDFVQSIDQSMTIDHFNWNDLFQDLESTFA